MVAQVLSTAAPPTLNCLLGTVLPAVVSSISCRNSVDAESTARDTTGRSSSRKSGEEGAVGTMDIDRYSQRDIAAVHAICNLAASVAASAPRGGGRAQKEGADPVQFRDKLSRSELRKLGPLGKEAEVALAEAFFYRNTAGVSF